MYIHTLSSGGKEEPRCAYQKTKETNGTKHEGCCENVKNKELDPSGDLSILLQIFSKKMRRY